MHLFNQYPAPIALMTFLEWLDWSYLWCSCRIWYSAWQKRRHNAWAAMMQLQNLILSLT